MLYNLLLTSDSTSPTDSLFLPLLLLPLGFVFDLEGELLLDRLLLLLLSLFARFSLDTASFPFVTGLLGVNFLFLVDFSYLSPLGLVFLSEAPSVLLGLLTSLFPFAVGLVCFLLDGDLLLSFTFKRALFESLTLLFSELLVRPSFKDGFVPPDFDVLLLAVAVTSSLQLLLSLFRLSVLLLLLVSFVEFSETGVGVGGGVVLIFRTDLRSNFILRSLRLLLLVSISSDSIFSVEFSPVEESAT